MERRKRNENKIDIEGSRREGISFYESQLPQEMVEQCRACGDVEEEYVKNLIEKYREYSAFRNDVLKETNGGIR